MTRCGALLALVMARMACAQAHEESIKFDVASLKPSNGAGDAWIHPMPGGERYVATHAPLRLFLMTLYRLKSDQVTGGPGWVDTALFDMDARAEKPSTMDELHTMLTNLLAERFELRFHFETKEGPVYVLTAERVKGMTPHAAGSAGDPSIAPLMLKPLHVKVTATATSMDYLAYALTTWLDRPVIDKTGIAGQYDFTLSYTAELAPGISPDRLVNGQPLDLSGPTLFEALHDQLGLRLAPQKGPVQMLVIDHVEKPSEN